MKIYFAALEPKELKEGRNLLLSYYDICLSDIPFRKRTWQIIIEGGPLNENIPRDVPL